GTSMVTQSGSAVSNSLSLIQNLRNQEATTKSQIGQDASQFGAAYPKLVQERASLKSIDQSLQEEIARMGERAKNDFDIAVETEAGAKQQYETNRKAAEALNDKTIEYTILSKEADESQALYQDLLKRLKEAGIMESLHSSNLTLVDVARVPAKPDRPKVPLYLGLGLVAGLFCGVCAAFLVEAVDNKVQGTEEVENLHVPLL